MPTHRTHKQSDLEKRLRLLNTQLYGKQKKLDVRSERIDKEVRNLRLQSPTSNIQLHNPSSNLQHPTSSSDTTFLRHDLTKIAMLSSLAVGVQLALHFAFSNNFLKLPF